MPTIIEGRLGGPVHRLQHHRLALEFLRTARRYADRAQVVPSASSVTRWNQVRSRLRSVLRTYAVYLPGDLREERSLAGVHALLYAALAVEAGANEIGEDVIESADLDAFINTKKIFQQPAGVSKVAWKWTLLMRSRFRGPLDADTDGVIRGVDRLVRERNSIAHYELSANATRAVFAAPLQDGPPWSFTVWDSRMVPTEIKPSPIAELFLPEAAARHIAAAEAVFALWSNATTRP